MTPLEKRRHPRLAYQGDVYLEEAQGDQLKATDLSQNGVGVVSSRQLGTGRRIKISFLGRNMFVTGTVRREAALPAPLWQIGIEFTQPQPELVDVAMKVCEPAP